jgi:hemoglobin-like flavoprotein
VLAQARRAGAVAKQGALDMNPKQIALVQDSFRKVDPSAATAVDLFYDRLFAIAPEVRRLFPDDLKEEEKKLIAMVATAVINLHQVDTIAPAVADLGRRHDDYGVKPEHYQPVGAALLWTLEQYSDRTSRRPSRRPGQAPTSCS